MITKGDNTKIDINEIALIMILVGDICFYTKETYNAYRLFFLGGIILCFMSFIRYFRPRIKKTSAIIWLTIIYSMYFLYGFYFLQAGVFDWDGILLRYIGNISIFLLLGKIFQDKGSLIVRPFAITGVITIAYIIFSESANIISGGQRIGDTLSGNVNTVGFNLGFISILVTWSYCLYKKGYKVFLIAILMIFMVLTGSKKALLIIILDLLLIFIYNYKKASTWLKIAFVLAVGIYIIFNVPYFYDILGSRVESMFSTMILGKTPTNLYSYSTDMREYMIREGFHMFQKKPFFGGGWNYFAANTRTHYEYSHCNYVELLCSFGLFGTLLFYSKPLSNLFYIIRQKAIKYDETKDLAILSIALIAEMAVADWATVTFSGQSAGYVPILLSCVLIEAIRTKMRNR